ncbi:hypothetical protein [Sphingomonas sp. ACRSK]|uniref:hypothetical protein n=1 Tax=Sphingomonas sp. ACRSK TaxID=2918213 RepID=UPI001EF3F22B|nr:hypothetical protein [Sphingomonas sp. ACRSK]MCG7348874.1 hypothetical protein [Sphingomonas sp. ACRSK]
MRTSRLPAFVHPHPIAGFFSAASKQDMQRLATTLRLLTDYQKAVIATCMVNARVMFPPLIYRIPAWIWVKRGRDELMFWAQVFHHPKFGTKLARGIVDDAARWAVSGQDREQSNSAGGFSQREVNFIVNSIAVIRGEMTAKEAV